MLFLNNKLYTILFLLYNYPLSGGETKWVLMTEEALSEAETATAEAETATVEAGTVTAEDSEAVAAAPGKCTK